MASVKSLSSVPVTIPTTIPELVIVVAEPTTIVVASICPVTFNSDPLNVRLPLSSSSPPVPAITTRLSVRSSTLKVFA